MHIYKHILHRHRWHLGVNGLIGLTVAWTVGYNVARAADQHPVGQLAGVMVALVLLSVWAFLTLMSPYDAVVDMACKELFSGRPAHLDRYEQTSRWRLVVLHWHYRRASEAVRETFHLLDKEAGDHRHVEHFRAAQSAAA